MATGTNGIATWNNISYYHSGKITVPSGATLTKCPTKTEITNAVNNSYTVQLGDYQSNQCIKLSDINPVSTVVEGELTINWWNTSINTGDAVVNLSYQHLTPAYSSGSSASAELGSIYNGVCDTEWNDYGGLEFDTPLITVTPSGASSAIPLKVSAEKIDYIGRNYGNGEYCFYYPFLYSSSGTFDHNNFNEREVLYFYFSVSIQANAYGTYIPSEVNDVYVSMPHVGMASGTTSFVNEIYYTDGDGTEEMWYAPLNTWAGDNYVGIPYNGGRTDWLDMLPNAGYIEEWDGENWFYISVYSADDDETGLTAGQFDEFYGGGHLNLLKGQNITTIPKLMTFLKHDLIYVFMDV